MSILSCIKGCEHLTRRQAVLIPTFITNAVHSVNISDKAYNQCQFTEGCRTSYLSETVLQKQKPAGLRAAELLTAEQ